MAVGWVSMGHGVFMGVRGLWRFEGGFHGG